MLNVGRLLILSCFNSGTNRATLETANRRNEFVAALATEISILYAAPGSRIEALSRTFKLHGFPRPIEGSLAEAETPILPK
jgi:hypothetical protein